MSLTSADLELFDRQIRLFGKNTQIKLINTSISISNPSNNISLTAGEFLKNIILLGVRKIQATESTINSLLKLAPDHLINNLNLNYEGECDINILIDCDSKNNNNSNNNNNNVFVCTKCKRFGTEFEHICNKRMDNVAIDCLLGAICVQKIVLSLDDENIKMEYVIEI